MILGIASATLIRAGLVAAAVSAVSIGGCVIYKWIGDAAVNKALVKGQKVQVEQRKEGIAEGKKVRKDFIKKSAKYPIKGKGLTPAQKLENAAKLFQ